MQRETQAGLGTRRNKKGWHSSRSLWRNRLARSAVNRKVGGSSPPRDVTFFLFDPDWMMPLSTLPKCRFLLVQKCEPDVIRTRNLLIWSQTRYRCAKESLYKVIVSNFMNKNVRYRILIFTLTQVKAMNRTKIGVTDIALEMFAEADDDGSGELSVIEIFF